MNVTSLRNAIRELIADYTHIDPQLIATDEPFQALGLSSRDAVTLSGDIEELTGQQIEPRLFWDYPTIDRLCAHLASEDASSTERQETPTHEHDASPGWAIIGLAGRFPGARSTTDLWTLLANRRDAVSTPAAERSAHTGGVAAGFIDDLARFEAAFFGVSPREAARTDPQHRQLLEVAWHALESAQLRPDRLRGSATGVFIGISSYDFALRQTASGRPVDAYAGVGAAHSVAANRLSYVFDWTGPSLALLRHV